MQVVVAVASRLKGRTVEGLDEAALSTRHEADLSFGSYASTAPDVEEELEQRGTKGRVAPRAKPGGLSARQLT